MSRVERQDDRIREAQQDQTKVLRHRDLQGEVILWISYRGEFPFSKCTHVSDKANVTIDFLPPLRVVDGMIVVHRIIRGAQEALIRARDLHIMVSVNDIMPAIPKDKKRTPRCWRKGVKSLPEPSAGIAKSKEVKSSRSSA